MVYNNIAMSREKFKSLIHVNNVLSLIQTMTSVVLHLVTILGCS